MIEPNKTADAAAQHWPGSIRFRLASGWLRLRRLDPKRRKRVLVGLDIGTEKTKAVVLSRPHGRVTVERAAIASTPAAALTDGVFTDSITIADHVHSMLRASGIRQKKVAVAAAGEKVFLRPALVPDDRDGDLLSFAREEAQKVLGYSIDSAALDFEAVETPGAAPRGIICAGTTAEQVEWLREAVTLAGKTALIVDVEACALVNAFIHSAEPRPEQTSLLVDAGARSLTMCVLRGTALLGCRQAALALNPMPVKLESPADRIAAALERNWAALTEMADPHKIVRIWLSTLL